MHRLHPGVAALAASLLAFVPSAAARPLSGGPPAGDTTVEVHWQRKRFDPATPPAELSSEARATLATWEPFVRELGYRLDLDPDARCLLLTPAEDEREARRRARTLEEALEAFDEDLPWCAPSWEPPATSDLVLRGHLVEPDMRPVVLLVLRDEQELAYLLDRMVERHPDLASFASASLDGPGFDLPQERLVARLVRPEGVQEWSLEHELVHGLAQGLLRERFGLLPHWFEQGVAWRVEQEACGDLYAFPGRDGFVAVEAHDGWEPDLKRLFQEREQQAVRLDDLNAWSSGTWDEPLASQAWGLVRFLAEHREGSLGPIAADLALHQELEALDVRPDGSWRRRPGVEVPERLQREVLVTHAGADGLVECAEAFRRGKRYRPRRR